MAVDTTIDPDFEVQAKLFEHIESLFPKTIGRESTKCYFDYSEDGDHDGQTLWCEFMEDAFIMGELESRGNTDYHVGEFQINCYYRIGKVKDSYLISQLVGAVKSIIRFRTLETENYNIFTKTPDTRPISSDRTMVQRAVVCNFYIGSR